MSKIFLLLTLFLTSCASLEVSRPQRTSTIRAKGTYYTVKKGDSLWKISRLYNIDIKKIMSANRITSARNLAVGQKIIIPTYRLANKKISKFAWPVRGEIVNFFGEVFDSSLNKGINIQANKGNEVTAAAEGKVLFAGKLKGWGKTVILSHGSEYYTIYANLEGTTPSEGRLVKKQQVIGEVALGKNGNRIIHFEIRKKCLPQNPLKYLN